MKKVILAVVLLGLGAAAGVLVYQKLLARDRQAAVGALRLHGNVDVRDAQLAFFGQERIDKVLVEEGDRVEPEQLLATLHSERLRAEIAAAEARIRAQQAVVDRLEHGARPEEKQQARAALAAAKVRVHNAEQVIVRVQTTAKSGASSAQELDNAAAALDVATAEQQVQEQTLALVLAGPREEDKSQAAATLDGMRADLMLLQQKLTDSKLYAPQRGVIQSRILEPGEMASPERAVFTLALTDPKWVRAYVPEPQLGRIQNGMGASIRSDSFGGRSYDGWVGFVSPVAEFTPKAVETDELRPQLVYEVRVFVRDPDGELPLGMPVTVDVDTEGARHTPEGGEVTDGIRVEQLQKRFAGAATPALRAVSFTAQAGAVTGLVGPDGAGKTTVIRIAAGLLLADAGSVTVLGLDPLQDRHELRQRIGYMPQKFGLYEDLTVQENLDLYADLQGVAKAQRRERFDRLMTMTGLLPFLRRLAGKLSGGMKQKLGLACALIKEPDFLLLDEPTVGVDPVSRRELWRIVDDLVQQRGIGVLVATAYLDEAERCSEVVVLDRGEVLEHGAPSVFAAALRGRVFELEPEAGELPRRIQDAIADVDGVIDATVRSGRVRIVAAEAAELDACFGTEGVAGHAAVTPQFEDAFMALLAPRYDKVQVAATAAPSPSADDSVAVRVRDLRKRFGDFEAVCGVSFEVHHGEIFGLLGPNGAGKSTTFRMLCGLSSITGGEATVAGADLRRSGKRARARLGYMAQKFSLYGSLSVLENLRFFGTAYGLWGRRLRQRIDAALDEFDLRARRGDAAGLLPGGYKQRLAMAAALLHEPDILFLDEPTSGVDPIARREFWRRINAVALQGTTVVVTTHFMAEAEYRDRMLIMSRGAELAIGTPAQIRALAQTPERPDPSIEDAFIVLAEQQAAVA